MALIGWLEPDFSGREIPSLWKGVPIKAEGSCVPLHVRDKLIVGRLEKRRGTCCDWDFEEPTISATHLRVYTISYDEDDVETLVFAEDLSSNGTYHNGRYMGRGQSAVVLLDGDVLKLCDTLTLRWRQSKELPRQLSQTQLREVKSFASSYHISDKLLGTGANGKVLVASHAFTKRQVACKIIDIAGYRKRIRDEIGNTLGPGPTEQAVRAAVVKKCKEVHILQGLSHPNIVAIEKVFRSDDTIYIMQELLVGGDLYSYCLDERLPEGIAAVIVRQVLEAVNYLHEREIVHRDIKPENVLLASRSALPRIVLIDFGEAKMLHTSKRTTTLTGTHGYMAPEMNELDSYTKAVDMWSVGVLAFVVVVGALPFGDEDDQANTFEAFQQVPSPRLRDFIRRLLVVNAAERMSVKESLGHHWFQNDCNRNMFDGAYRRAIRGWSAANEDIEDPLHDAEDGTKDGVKVGRRRNVTV